MQAWILATIRHLVHWVKTDRTFYIYLVVLLLLAAAAVATFVQFFPLSRWDIEASTEVQEHPLATLDALMWGVSWFGNGIQTGITVAIASALLYFADLKKAAGATAATLLATPLILFLKWAFGRPRPTADLVRTMYDAQYESFPSGHVLYYTLLFGFILFLSFKHPLTSAALKWTVRIALSSLIVLVSFSRMYLGAHWMTDVIAGYLVGFVLLIGWCLAYVKWVPWSRPAA